VPRRCARGNRQGDDPNPAAAIPASPSFRQPRGSTQNATAMYWEQAAAIVSAWKSSW
jgi:hypothetical protein